jgi:DNA-binding IclR family transcriptional regulator
VEDRHRGAEHVGGVQVIARVAQVLRALDGESAGLSLTQLAERVELPRSTVHRIVTALIAEGFLASASPAGRVRIGPEFAKLASAGTADLWRSVEPMMRQIFDQVDETVDCSVLDGDRVRLIHVIPTRTHHLRAIADVGATFPVHTTSKGKAILAEYDNDTVRRMLPATLERYTENTATSSDMIIRELETVRKTGVAYGHEEATPGICSAAIAIRDRSGVWLSISVTVPAQRYYEMEDEITRVLTDALRGAQPYVA